MRLTSLLALGAALATPALAAPPPFSAAAFKSHVTFLADDLLQGRDTGSPGHEIAARYIAAQFEAIGLKPGGDKGGWYQRFSLAETTQSAPGSLTLTGPAGEKTWADGSSIVVRRDSAHPNPDASGQLVFAGYGIDDPKNGHDDYRGLDVRGKIVVLLRGFPKDSASEAGAYYVNAARMAAAKRGATGIIYIYTPSGRKLRPWPVVVRGARFASVTWSEADGKPHDDGGVGVVAYADGNVAEAMFAGAPRTFQAVLDEAERSKGAPKGFALKTSAHIVDHTATRTITSPNVIGILPGSDPKLAAEYIVLSAHSDHIGVTPASPSDTPTTDRINNGAMDNAAGIATLIEVAKAAMADPSKPRRSLVFLASTGEEKGLLGADYYARHPTVPAAGIVGDVDLDMPVLTYHFTDVIAYGADHSTIGPTVAKVAQGMDLSLSPDPTPAETIFVRSDHYRFVEQGVPAVFLVNGYAGEGRAAWEDFLAHHYHQPSDDLTRPILWEEGARFADINYRVTRAMADADQRPMWFKGDFFGEKFAAGEAKAEVAR